LRPTVPQSRPIQEKYQGWWSPPFHPCLPKTPQNLTHWMSRFRMCRFLLTSSLWCCGGGVVVGVHAVLSVTVSVGILLGYVGLPEAARFLLSAEQVSSLFAKILPHTMEHY